jgi:hypothetical protein
MGEISPCFKAASDAESVGLYAEAQRGLHCCAAALTSMLCRQLAKGPQFIAGYLRSTNVPIKGWDDFRLGYYGPSGK